MLPRKVSKTSSLLQFWAKRSDVSKKKDNCPVSEKDLNSKHLSSVQENTGSYHWKSYYNYSSGLYFGTSILIYYFLFSSFYSLYYHLVIADFLIIF
uniref:Ovule protein n=1 Tax=Heterorhabditis bacteriophora TaxID=37862 RepID=A0A1I7X1P5_HETBA